MNPSRLQVLLVGLDSGVHEIVHQSLLGSDTVEQVRHVNTPEQATADLIAGRANTVFIDPVSHPGTSLREMLQFCTMTFPVCLVGTATDLSTLQGIPTDWQKRLRNYHRVQIDVPLPEFREQLDYAIRGCHRYLLKRLIRNNLSEIVESARTPAVAEKAREVLQAVDVQSELSDKLGITPAQMEAILDHTLQHARQVARRAELANLVTLAVGLMLIIVTAAFALFNENANYWSLGLGGMGAAAVIAALVTSPSQRLASSTLRLVFVQTAYFSFLQQVRLLNSPGPESALQRSERLEGATGALLERLKFVPQDRE
jgi:hypothetical protein